MSDFKESEHPRDADGKFTVKGKQSKRKALFNLLRQKRAKTSSKISGAISGANNGAFDDDARKEEAEALKKYDKIRKDNTDIRKISKNIGVAIEKVRIAKEHLFFDKHVLDIGYTTFQPDIEIAESWERLTVGKGIKEQDRILVLHEYLEAIYMKQGLTYNEAHKLANKKYNYEQFYR